MNAATLIKQRLDLQHIAKQSLTTPGEIVYAMGAMQAQDYAGAKWSLALRLPKATDTDIENAISQKQVVRTWALRNTLHFVSPKDIRWMLTLLRDKLVHNAALNNNRIGLDEKTLTKANGIITKALEGGKVLTREALGIILQQKKLDITENRLSHFLGRAAIDQLICFGPRQDKSFTFTLLDNWIPATPLLSREESLAALAERYLNSHGPATLKDFTWWAGLPPAMAREAFILVKDRFSRETIEEAEYWFPSNTTVIRKTAAKAYLLPGFDEYMLGYTGRSFVAEAPHVKKLMGLGNAVFPSTIVFNGKIEGTWKRMLKKNSVLIEATAFSTFSEAKRNAIVKAAKNFARFLQLPAEVTF